VIGIFAALPPAFLPGPKDDPISLSILRITFFGVFNIICLVTTVVATCLILLKIWITSRRIQSPFSYKRLGAILIESGVLYATVLLGHTVFAVIQWTFSSVNAFGFETRYNVAVEVFDCLMMPLTVSTLIVLVVEHAN